MPRMRWDSWRIGTTPATAGGPLVGTMLCPACAEEMVKCLLIRRRGVPALEFAKIG